MKDEVDDHDLGFAHDLPRMIGRRGALMALGGLGAWGLGANSSMAQTIAACVADAQETAGPYPADGTNARAGQAVNVLTEAGVVRQDIRSSFAGFEGTAEGADFDMEVTLANVGASCGPLEGYAIYAWHCDTVGRYSLYDIPNANFLRGVGVADANGTVRFTTAFPGCYRSRWPHIHFEVFESVEAAVSGRQAVLTSQFILPEDACRVVYGDEVYATSIANLNRQTLGRDNIFANDSAAQTAQRTIAVEHNGTGYAGKVTVGLAL